MYASAATSRLPVVFRRLIRFQHMDFELALWQLTYLCISPRKVYKQVYYHKQTHNTWARNDPAMLVLIAAGLSVAAIAWSITYQMGPLRGFELALLMVFRDFILVGIIVATLLWLLANNLLAQPASLPSTTTEGESSRVEWGYAFDVHCNSFVPVFVELYVLQLILSPIVIRDNLLSLFLGNSLYFLGFAQYIHITYLGYNALPFLVRTETFLFPMIPLLLAFVGSLFGFNVAQAVLAWYFKS